MTDAHPRDLLLRPLTDRWAGDLLALNDRHVELTSPMDRARLDLLASRGAVEVLDVDGEFAGFVITFAADSGHDSGNFHWFQERYPDFVYLDRIVIHEDFRRRGLASVVYDEIESRTAAPLLTLEVNSDPPNEVSLAFHAARGYEPVGEREIVEGEHSHRVALLVKRLG